MPDEAILKLKVQLYCGGEVAMGPGKADLLEAIQREGSISGAARAMGMSYRRAWLLVDTMNRCWSELLVETAPGRALAGARISPFGERMLAHYRALQASIDAAASCADFDALRAGILPRPRKSKQD